MERNEIIELLRRSEPIVLPPAKLCHTASRCYHTKHMLHNAQFVESFSTVGTHYDNAVVESFFGSIRRDQIYQNVYTGREALMDAVEEYIYFYNHERPQQWLRMLTPVQAEEAYFA